MGVDKLFELLQQLDTAHTVVLRPTYTHEGPEVAKLRGGQDRVNDGVTDYVTVGVALAPVVLRVQHAGYPALFAWLDLMGIERGSHAKILHAPHRT